MAYDRPATPIAGRAPGLTGEKSWLIRLNDGATVTGTLVKNGEPLEGIGMTLSGKNRSAGEFAGYYDAVTDSKGQFHFFTIPALGDFVISAKMDTVGKHGATVARTIRLSKNGEIVDAGDLDVKPGVRLEGRVILSDGEALPLQQSMNAMIRYSIAAAALIFSADSSALAFHQYLCCAKPAGNSDGIAA
ncbi:MAG: hypothetical protein O2960_19310 [Verrucomicrobia bacterium]|nr:hypothetical protein [Verrucomicrobiota bacterium]